MAKAKKNGAVKKSKTKVVPKTLGKKAKAPAKKAKASVKKAKAPAKTKAKTKMKLQKKSATKPRAVAKVVARPVAVKSTPTKASNLSFSKMISPLDDRILVQLVEGEKITAGGLIIPETAEFSGNLKGKVVAVGRGHLNKKGHTQPLQIVIGDEIVFADHSGSKINLEGQDLVMLRETEVLGIVETSK